MKKRVLASLLTLVLLLALLPVSALAASAGTPCTDADCEHVAAIGETHYDSLDAAVTDVQPGDTIKLLRDIALADGAQIRIVNKGTADHPITLDFNGKTITGNNGNTDKPNKAEAKSGILFLDGCHISMVDTSTAGTKGGVVNNTTASSGQISALVVISYSAPSSNVIINDGLRFEVDKAASARGIYHYRGNKAELYLTINDAYVSSGGYVLDCARLSGNGEVVINGGTFISKKGNNSSPLYGEATLKINGGTFHNWSSKNIDKVTDDHTVSMAESDGKYIYTVISEANAPTEYVASMQTSSGKTVYMTAGSDVYDFSNIQSLDKRTIHVAKNAACNVPAKFAIGYKNSSETQGSMLTLDLADGVRLTGSVYLNSADVIVTGNGDTSGFSCVPVNDEFEMTVNGENGVYSCRMKVDGGAATLVKTDGTKIGYATAPGALTAAKGDPGSVVVLNEDASATSTTKLGAFADITLDLNGHTYTFTYTKNDGFQLTNGAKLTIINSNESQTGTFIATGRKNTKANSAILTKNPGGGTIEIGENVTVKGPIVLLGEGSEATVAGTVDATGLKEFAISGNGTAGQGNTKITIKDTAVVKSDSNCPAIYHPQSGTLTVEGGTIQGGTGIQMCSGDLIISGSPTITATGTHALEKGGSSGSVPDGAAISVINRNYPGGTPTVTITGTPAVKAESGVEAVQVYTYSYTTAPVVNGWADAAESVSISGGTYHSGDVRSNVDQYIPEDTALTQDAEGTVIPDTSVKAVAEVNGVPYKTLQAAIDDARTTAAEIKLLDNVTEAITIADGQNITLDLNGHMLKNNDTEQDKNVPDNNRKHTITNNGTLTITDSSAEKKGIVDNLSHGRAAVLNNNGAACTILAGTITRSSEKGKTPDDNGSNSFYTIDNYGTMSIGKESGENSITVTANGHYSSLVHNGWQTSKAADGKEAKMTIYGGTFTGGINTIKNDENGFLTIHDGEFTNTIQYALQNWNVATVNGGTFQSETMAAVYNNGDTAGTSDGKLTITGGTFIGADGKNALRVDNKAKETKVSGGSFSSPVPADYCAEGFVPVTEKDADGKYTVAQVTVTDESSNVTIEPATLIVGQTAALVTKVGGQPVNATWTVDPASDVITIENGKITANKEGTATVKATVGGQSIALTVTVNPVPTYTVAAPDAENGTVTVTPANARKGDTVTITATPDEGYELNKLTVVDDNGNTVELTDEGDGKYTFTMPDCKVTVEAAFTKIGDKPVNLPFVDVFKSDYYYDAVKWGVENGVTNGTSATTFSPDEACTRAQMVTFLWRASGSPEPESNVCPFTDVDLKSYYGDAVLWAAEQGITLGTSATTFSPNEACTRAHAVTFLWRMAKGTATETDSFSDVPADAYYAEAVQWAKENGFTLGTSATTFSPNEACTRAQMITFIYRYFVK